MKNKAHKLNMFLEKYLFNPKYDFDNVDQKLLFKLGILGFMFGLDYIYLKKYGRAFWKILFNWVLLVAIILTSYFSTIHLTTLMMTLETQWFHLFFPWFFILLLSVGLLIIFITYNSQDIKWKQRRINKLKTKKDLIINDIK